VAVSSQGSTFTFNGNVMTVTSVSVRAPKAEYVDMTSFDVPVGKKRLIATGDIATPASMEVEGFGIVDPKTIAGTQGDIRFQTQAGDIVLQKAVCDDASVSASVGDFLRLRMTFILCDYLVD